MASRGDCAGRADWIATAETVPDQKGPEHMGQNLDFSARHTESGVPFGDAEGRQMRALAAEQAIRSKVLSNGWLGD